MVILRIQLFGKFQIFRNGTAIHSLDGPRLQELLAYLILHRERPLSRENLAGLFWGQYPSERARKYLRQSLWQLHTVLESGKAGHQWLSVDSEWVQFRANSELWLDVAEFEATLRRAVPRAPISAPNPPAPVVDKQPMAEERPRWQILREAADLYQGELLPGCYQDWCLYERERLQDLYLKLLDELMDACEAASEFELGLQYGTKVLRYDRARERTHRRLMRLYYLSGDRTGALRQYQRCVGALQDELDVEPTQRTLVLVDQIRSGLLHSSSRELPLAASPDPNKLVEVLDHLNSLNQVFRSLQNQIVRDIHVVEQLLEEHGRK